MLAPNSLTTRLPSSGQSSSPWSPPPSSFLFYFLHSMNIRRLTSISPSSVLDAKAIASCENAMVSPVTRPFSLTKRLQPRVRT
ncbi:hypothetical protein U9M48_036179 [Paspalum notatum var. saurae]|uniref:Uncharacterized protein n=1 Tax=Paspalum notatum var. saurae TaxID=547442 RepID=A0AAQ3UDJ0_PASNO